MAAFRVISTGGVWLKSNKTLTESFRFFAESANRHLNYIALCGMNNKRFLSGNLHHRLRPVFVRRQETHRHCDQVVRATTFGGGDLSVAQRPYGFWSQLPVKLLASKKLRTCLE